MAGLMDIITRSKNAMGIFSDSLRIRSNNEANMGTTGYKAIRHSFKTVFNDVMSEGFEGSSTVGAQNPTQFGSDVSMGNISLDFSQGTLGEGTALDCAISGRGVFIVSPDGGKTKYYTRAGEFHVDSTGQYIVDSSGRQLMGTTPGSYSGALTPIKTNGSTDLGWAKNGILVSGYQNEKDGKGTSTPLYQIVLADFTNIEGLTQYDGTAFIESDASGQPNKMNIAGNDNLGNIEPQELEKSNVFFIGETIDSIETQRAISAMTTSIKIASDIISQVINKLLG
jgi:flagellar hook protein FlgE